MRLLPILILIAGCAGTTADGQSREQRALAADLEGRSPGAPQACVPARQNQSMQIVDSRTIVYRDFDTIYVNRLDGACPSLRPLNILVVEAHGSRYCRGDRVRGQEPHSNIPGPLCVLRDFVPYRKAG
jgi:hypothetical protein